MINWAQLVETGRAKAHGIPWTEEEAKARALGVPADHVRQGILTLEESRALVAKEEEHEIETGEKPLGKMSKVELLAKAKELGIEVTPDANVGALREIIKETIETKSNE